MTLPPDPTTTDETKPETVAGLLQARAGDDAPGVLFEDRSWTWRQVVVESERRAAALAARHRRPGPFHIGVLLDNVPDYLFWLGGAALAGATVVGINPTRRGQELARDIRFADCQLVVTDAEGANLLHGLDLGIAPDRLLRVDAFTADTDDAAVVEITMPEVAPSDLYLLLFTSGTTGSPKAVKCTQGRLAAIAWRAALGYGFRRDDICYCPMPLFHGNAIMALWGPGHLRGRHRGPHPSVHGLWLPGRCPPPPGHPLHLRRESSGLRPDHPRGAGRCRQHAPPGFRDRGLDPRSGRLRSPFRLPPGRGLRLERGRSRHHRDPRDPARVAWPARPGRRHRRLFTADHGRVSPRPLRRRRPLPERRRGHRRDREPLGQAANFEGYYNNAEGNAERVHAGWYWTGDLAYRDERGFFYFAGRGDDWLRVDSENFAAAPIERIVERHPDLAAVAVYAVADPRSGDAVMAAVELRPGVRFDPAGFAAFLSDQPDLGTKWAPRFVRIMDALPLTATGKITKASLRRTSWLCQEPVFWAPDRHLRATAP